MLVLSLADMQYLCVSIGLPTRSREVAEFMTGLEKTKAKDGEVSQSARALEQSAVFNIYHQCISNPAQRSQQEERAAVVRYVRAPPSSMFIADCCKR